MVSRRSEPGETTRMGTNEQQRHFQEELDTLKARILAMGGLAEDRIEVAMAALVSGDRGRLAGVRNGDEPINQLHLAVDALAFRLLALYQPMASDLRAIVAAIKISSDLERIGDLAVNIAEAADRYVVRPAVKPLLDLPRMSAIAQGMLRDALDAFVRRDVALAHEVLERDDTLDGLKTQVFRELLTYMLQDPTTIEGALELLLVSRHLERVGDHATNIAEDIIFVVSAKDVRHAHAPGTP
jgi:phosphate transport system protein